ncbi:MAG: hypothetical protein QOF18_413 [Frankiaceae bacterium]|jgi:hypothetical protein|nr:hypothetical protein [Frankiaceae bacterium]
MRRLAVIAAAATAVLAALRSWRTRRADAELWEEATSTRDLR